MKKYKYNSSFIYEGRRYTIHADTKADLAVKKALKIRDIQDGKVVVTSSMLVKDWAEKCVETYKTRQKEITRKTYLYRMNAAICNQRIGGLQLKQVKPIDCQTTMNLQAGKSASQINEVYQMLQFIFSKAVENRLLNVNPAQYITKPQGTRKKRRAITDYERKHIIKVALTKRQFYLYLLMLYCGCRPSEAAEAMGKDIMKIDDRNVLHIRGQKTSNADRYVPIPNELYPVIKKTPKNEYIASYDGIKQIGLTQRRNVWESFVYKLNISMGCETHNRAIIPPYRVAPDLVPYCLRHTYCTDLARMGVDIRLAQKLMGHSDISLTANIYTNFDFSDIKKAADIINSSAK